MILVAPILPLFISDHRTRKARIAWGAILAVSILATSWHADAADQCGRDDVRLIDKRAGTHASGIVNFNYESRVETSTIAKTFIYCIENTSKYQIAEFRWGSSPDMEKDARYFSAIVEPGKKTPERRDDSADYRNDLRYIGFKKLSGHSWDAIAADTIFNSRVGSWGSRNLVSGRNAYAQVAEPLPFAVDLQSLSRNADAFATLVRNQGGRFYLIDQITVTLPTNLDTLLRIENETYEEYNPKDFVRVLLKLENFFDLKQGSPMSTIYLEVAPEDKAESARVDEALSTIQALLRFGLLPVRLTPA
jgi:hypothetical protein